MSRFPRTFLLCMLWIAALLMAPAAYGQVSSAGPAAEPQTVVDILHDLSDKADIVFTGQVLAIRHPTEGVVEVEFRVDQAIRGCTAERLLSCASGLAYGRATVNVTALGSVC